MLAGYLAVSSGYFGWRLLPHPGTRLVGTPGWDDPAIFVWSLGWWPHAILSGINPFYSHAVYSPVGVNLAWVTSVPGLAIALSPITLLFGPLVAYNVAALLAPALSAWTAFLLLRALTRSSWGAIVGGYLYGFSSFMLANEYAGHLHLSAAFCMPLILLAGLRFVRGELGGRGLTWRLGALLAFQASISTEVAVTATLVFGSTLALAALARRSVRAALRPAVIPVLAAYSIAAAVTSPLVYYALLSSGPVSLAHPGSFSADLLNLIVPTTVTGWGGQTFASVTSHFPGNTTERDSYVGIPTLLTVVLLLLRRPWPRGAGLILATFGVATFLSLGTDLYVNGRHVMRLPSSWLYELPGLDNILPSRLAGYATLALAALAAFWIAAARGRVFARPYVLPVIAVAAIAPPFWTGAFVQTPPQLPFFQHGDARACIPKGATLLVFPFGRWGDSLIWQAESGFRFNIAEGALGPPSVEGRFIADPVVENLHYNFDAIPPPSMTELRGLADRMGVDKIVSAATMPAIRPYSLDALSFVYPTVSQLRQLGPTERVADVYVTPGCGPASLQAVTRSSTG